MPKNKTTDLSAKAAAKRLSEMKAAIDLEAKKAAAAEPVSKSEKTKSRMTKAEGEVPREEKTPKIKWALVIPALVIIVAALCFVFTSRTGVITTFLTPKEKLLARANTDHPEDIKIVEGVTTDAEKETLIRKVEKETTTEETTEEFIPSYYVIKVNTAYNYVTIYERGEKLNDGYDKKDPYDDEYDLIPVKAFTCSTGVDGATPHGTYYLGDRSEWCFMYGDVYARYATRIVDGIMFHSVPYFTRDASDLETYEYNILGYPASSGCIRLTCEAAYWIYCYCAMDTEVRIFEDWGDYTPIEPDPVYTIPTDIPQLCGWDPTDIYTGGNPWLSYSPSLTNSNVQVPYGCSVDYLLAEIGPTDEYGNNLSNYFWTDGGYSLWEYGTYYTTGHISVGNLNYTYDITITVTDDAGYVDHDDGGGDDYTDEGNDYTDEDGGDDYGDGGDDYGDGGDDYGDGGGDYSDGGDDYGDGGGDYSDGGDDYGDSGDDYGDGGGEEW